MTVPRSRPAVAISCWVAMMADRRRASSGKAGAGHSPLRLVSVGDEGGEGSPASVSKLALDILVAPSRYVRAGHPGNHLSVRNCPQEVRTENNDESRTCQGFRAGRWEES